jgi:hypothetical protein
VSSIAAARGLTYLGLDVHRDSISVATVAEEAVRDLCRTRADLLADRTRARHRLSKFLLRHGRVWRGGVGHPRGRQLAAAGQATPSRSAHCPAGLLRGLSLGVTPLATFQRQPSAVDGRADSAHPGRVMVPGRALSPAGLRGRWASPGCACEDAPPGPPTYCER